jgi:hypothetical protein
LRKKLLRNRLLRNLAADRLLFGRVLRRKPAAGPRILISRHFECDPIANLLPILLGEIEKLDSRAFLGFFGPNGANADVNRFARAGKGKKDFEHGID